MKKILVMLLIILTFNLLAISCSDKASTSGSEEKTNPTMIPTVNPTVKPEPTIPPTEQPDPTKAPTPEPTIPPLSSDNFDPTAAISDTIPAKYSVIRKDYCGTIKQIYYKTYDYFGDSSEITKPAYVYLPYGYDETKQYNVLYLMHGIGGNEKEWGMYTNASAVKAVMDNLIYYGDIEPFIVVVPNGRSSVNFADASSDYNSFYLFGKELRNDLIPYIEANFATYAQYNDNGYDMTATRDHRAMAGLSMGGMQTINIGLCESLDIISYFGAFSACPTTNTSDKIVESLKNFKDYDINYFYNICGTADGVALASATAAVSNITSLTDKLVEGKNYMWQDSKDRGHDFTVWYPGFYNFAQLVFKNKE
ncbi:MAG TPA: alpha/beta hydrolase-fold protein [Mobilitalea sp.]|nr:alpha/beta hydrolase-fold protein [Mobilitalea sp.]